jgi:hypothetical protein
VLILCRVPPFSPRHMTTLFNFSELSFKSRNIRPQIPSSARTFSLWDDRALIDILVLHCNQPRVCTGHSNACTSQREHSTCRSSEQAVMTDRRIFLVSWGLAICLYERNTLLCMTVHANLGGPLQGNQLSLKSRTPRLVWGVHPPVRSCWLF